MSNDADVDDIVDVGLFRANGAALTTKVQIEGYRIVLHRAGTLQEATDGDFRATLELVLHRLLLERIRPFVTLHQAPPPRRSMKTLDDFELVPPLRLKGSAGERADTLYSASQGKTPQAWPTMELNIPWMPHYALASILEGVAERRPEGLDRPQLRRVEARHLQAAIDEVQEIERYTRFRDATGYWLIPPDGGDPLPPKKVFGIALAEALRTYTTPNDFSSGPLIFDIMRDRGFDVVRQEDLPRRSPGGAGVGGAGTSPAEIPLTDEERRWLEGNPKFVAHMRNERSGKAPGVFKDDFRKQHGRLFCERCDEDFVAAYGTVLAEGCFEVHHKIPVSHMKPNHVTTSDQLQLLCANCHRITHREMALRR
ncbi:HNH endonuclease [Caulobacter rhizosphaerae]|uniref:HNH endonuclease n=1 Tax=Caulobacter rhizosphaerae TaxID=2010972 RepID=UPI0013D0F8BE|nr:HNH endonuclease [Caulobacter rhizosphaerae]